MHFTSHKSQLLKINNPEKVSSVDSHRQCDNTKMEHVIIPARCILPRKVKKKQLTK